MPSPDQMGAPFPAARAMPLSDGYGGKITAYDELPIHALGDDYAVEGNGTVTRLSALPAGMRVDLRMIGTPTFKNSTRLICPNGVDYVAAAGDLAIVRSDGDGVWRLFVLPASGEVLADRAISLSTAQKAQVQSNIFTAVTYSTALNSGATTGTGGFVSGTYTTPAGVKRIEVRGVGGGGGSAGSGVSGTSTNGAAGGNTTFGTSLLTANGGNGPAAAGFSAGGSGGTATGPAGGLYAQGGDGGGSLGNVSGSTYPPTQPGGGSALGGTGGAGGANSVGQPGKANTGGGGGGPGANNSTSTISGAAGGAGGFFHYIISSPAATYPYSVGASGSAGTAGTSGNAGSVGGTGGIWVIEYYS